MNTASRMESNGTPNLIQVSQKTADLLTAAGKGQWLARRTELISAKGKGLVQTYWVEPKGTQSTTGTDMGSSSSDSYSASYHGIKLSDDLATEGERLIDWAVSVIEESCQNLIAFRQTRTFAQNESEDRDNTCDTTGIEYTSNPNIDENGHSWSVFMPRDEIVDCIEIPKFEQHERRPFHINAHAPLPDGVMKQLRAFVSSLAEMYPANEFHNFSHACHVTLSTRKLLLCVITHSPTLTQEEIYFHSFGLALDPLAHVALLLAGLSHDVQHPGVTNAQFMEEHKALAAKYHRKSVAEQNSVDFFWKLLMDDKYTELRSFLFLFPKDLDRFRQYYVNAVIATDIFDPELKAMRDERWEMAFSEAPQSDDSNALARKATIVLEHLIQASDVCHTMQHWSIYQKWNRKLFREVYRAYQAGRGGDEDPSHSWYEGELKFFDTYVIPLAKKLHECQVFGALSQELVECALENQLEWEKCGREIVGEMVEEVNADSQWNKPTSDIILVGI